ncbi:dihydroorotase [Turneriella parva]|uniref:Dihydroorotase n=1 Tax=Turneriella parva (strain ATCC BAA-1111 / DSM 21527 / NCTC 11395 / H) TaxID=869212 RepID=I4B6T5_TURPD|nr:dihydroorotase [Turneriella parva]AFM12992.1 dihydroorotase [Turneriella parva DSM 21527]
MPAAAGTTITIIQPDDWHLHLRDGAALAAVLPHTAERFARAIVMPNLKPPVTTVAEAMGYRERILAALPAGLQFEPLMTLYLTANTTPAEIRRAKASGIVHAVKLYPAGATTNSEAGVSALAAIYPVLEAMQEVDLPLLVHGEVTDANVDVFDREKVFLETELTAIIQKFPTLRVVFEHITTREAADFVEAAAGRVAATITAHHLLMNRNELFAGGIRPHHYCLPVLKREEHRQRLVAAATSGSKKFFIGTDSAPHAKHTKENACGCAGMYTANAGIELYAEVFDAAGALDRLQGFMSEFGPQFYGLPLNSKSVTLIKKPKAIPHEFPFGDQTIVPLRAGGQTEWQIVS